MGIFRTCDTRKHTTGMTCTYLSNLSGILWGTRGKNEIFLYYTNSCLIFKSGNSLPIGVNLLNTVPQIWLCFMAKICMSFLNLTWWKYPYFCVSYDARVPLLRPGGHFKNLYKLVNLRALKFSTWYKNRIFQCVGKIFCVEFQSSLWNSTQNILPIHWKMYSLLISENFQAPRFTIL